MVEKRVEVQVAVQASESHTCSELVDLLKTEVMGMATTEPQQQKAQMAVAGLVAVFEELRAAAASTSPPPRERPKTEQAKDRSRSPKGKEPRLSEGGAAGV